MRNVIVETERVGKERRKGEGGAGGREEKEGSMRLEDATLLALKLKEGPGGKKCRKPPEAGKNKKPDSLLEPPEGTQPC